MIFDKAAETTAWGMILRQLDTHVQKKMNLESYLTPYVEIKSKWVK